MADQTDKKLTPISINQTLSGGPQSNAEIKSALKDLYKNQAAEPFFNIDSEIYYQGRASLVQQIEAASPGFFTSEEPWAIELKENLNTLTMEAQSAMTFGDSDASEKCMNVLSFLEDDLLPEIKDRSLIRAQLNASNPGPVIMGEEFDPIKHAHLMATAEPGDDELFALPENPQSDDLANKGFENISSKYPAYAQPAANDMVVRNKSSAKWVAGGTILSLTMLGTALATSLGWIELKPAANNNNAAAPDITAEKAAPEQTPVPVPTAITVAPSLDQKEISIVSPQDTHAASETPQKTTLPRTIKADVKSTDQISAKFAYRSVILDKDMREKLQNFVDQAADGTYTLTMFEAKGRTPHAMDAERSKNALRLARAMAKKSGKALNFKSGGIKITTNADQYRTVSIRHGATGTLTTIAKTKPVSSKTANVKKSSGIDTPFVMTKPKSGPVNGDAVPRTIVPLSLLPSKETLQKATPENCPSIEILISARPTDKSYHQAITEIMSDFRKKKVIVPYGVKTSKSVPDDEIIVQCAQPVKDQTASTFKKAQSIVTESAPQKGGTLRRLYNKLSGHVKDAYNGMSDKVTAFNRMTGSDVEEAQRPLDIYNQNLGPHTHAILDQRVLGLN